MHWIRRNLKWRECKLAKVAPLLVLASEEIVGVGAAREHGFRLSGGRLAYSGRLVWFVVALLEALAPPTDCGGG